MPGTSVSFDGNSLQTSTIATQTIDHESMATKLVVPYVVAHANQSVVPFQEYSNKIVTLTGTIQAASIAAMDAALDVFRGYFINKDAFLDIGYNGSTRRYIGTTQSVSFDRTNGLSYAKFTVVILVTQPFGHNTSSTAAVNITGATASSRTDSYTFLGSAPVQLPVATITINTLTSSGAQPVSFGNSNNGQQITVTRVWSASDVVQIDCVNRVVTVNGILTDYIGAFPEFPPGAQSMTYSDGFSARNINYNVSYYQAWL